MQLRQRYIAMVIVGVVAAGAGGVIGVIILLDAIGIEHGSASRAHYAVLAVLALVIAVAGAALAVFAEHQLHHLPGGGSVWADNEGWRTSDSRWQAGGRRSLHAPASFAVVALVTTAVTGIAIASAVQAYTGSQRSSYTQSHGVKETAIADNVQNIASRTQHGGTNQSASYTSTSYTNQITITVRHPAVGDGSATVYGNGWSSLQSGDTFTVLVDPRQPDYAEIPGAPFYTTGSWIEGLLFAVAFGCVAVFMSRRAIIMALRHRRVAHGRLHAVHVLLPRSVLSGTPG
jgi:hypothetical protein